MTNKMGYPQVIVDMVDSLQYVPHEGISVTQLIDSPLIYRLSREHGKDVQDDIHNHHTSFFGQLAHSALHLAPVLSPSIREQRIMVDIGGTLGNEITLHGTPDIYYESGLLQDYKTVSAWTAVFDKVKKWTEQLNVYAYLLHKLGKVVTDLEIVVIYRDWSAEKARQSQTYPQKWADVVKISQWTPEEQEQYIRQRLDLFQDSEYTCSREERWEKPSTWAVMKRGAKRALRVFDSEDDASDYMFDVVGSNVARIVERPGENTRCERYCNCRPWCPRYANTVVEEVRDEPDGLQGLRASEHPVLQMPRE